MQDIGSKAATGLFDFLKELEKERTSVEFKWFSPNNELHLWEGRLDKITFLRTLLENVPKEIETIETIKGVVTLLSVTGRIEIVPEGESYPLKVKYPKGKPELVAGLTLHQQVILKVSKTVIFDTIKNIDIQSLRLIERISG